MCMLCCVCGVCRMACVMCVICVCMWSVPYGMCGVHGVRVCVSSVCVLRHAEVNPP